jgi:hypothetical protein
MGIVIPLYLGNIMSENNSKLVDEHFWITATTLAFNAFIISAEIKSDSLYKILASSIVSVFAIFLIIHRSAAHANKIEYPHDVKSIAEKDKSCKHKLVESWAHIKIVIKHIPFVICELSGALFYIVLIVLSFMGVIVTL